MTIRTLKPVDDFGAAPDRDHAKDGYSLLALEARLTDCEQQPDWHARADVAHAYYDFKQLTPEKQRKIEVEMGIEPRQTNLIHGVINGVLGQEARSRSDCVVEADDDDFQDVSDVLSMRMKEATRESNSDMAISNGYAGQVKGGIGWVEVSRATDPLDYPYRVQEVHRKEIWYDWRAKHIGLNDATWLIRKRWEDLDEAVAMMPEHRAVLMNSVSNGWTSFLPGDTDATGSTGILSRGFRDYNATRINRDEWCDSARRRIKFYEVWYRVPAEVVVLHLGPTRRVMFDEANPLHVEAVSRNRVKISKAITRQIRMALFAGPHRLVDVATTLRSFPYVPFFAFRDDEDRSPYGLIEGMISPQDEYNERRQMVNWMLKARQLEMDSDALDVKYNNINDITRSVGRPDFVAITNPARQNKGEHAIRIGNKHMELQREQVEVMQDAKQLIQEVPRIYSTQLGDAPAGVTSGVAINSLTDAGAVAMGELNDNYRFARKAVHEKMLDLIVEDHLDEELRVVMGAGQSKRTVILNTWDPKTGAPVNRVKDAPIKVGLSDVPSSPAFRMQEQQQVATMIQALAGNQAALNILAPAYIEGSSLTNRQAIADDLRRATGVPVAGDRKAQAQAQAQQQQMLEEQQALARKVAMAEAAEKETKALVNESQAGLNQARAAQLGHQVAIGEHQAVQAMQPQPMPAPTEEDLINDALAEASQPPRPPMPPVGQVAAAAEDPGQPMAA